ncbi:MAG: hypothetical protein QOJ67_3485 [Acidimicrobiaceae bacterium]|jgi:hypothetical protein
MAAVAALGVGASLVLALVAPLVPIDFAPLLLGPMLFAATVFRVVAFSKPQQLLSRIAGPVARKLQAEATNRYLDAMERADA